jgi:hypothetical protein
VVNIRLEGNAAFGFELEEQCEEDVAHFRQQHLTVFAREIAAD